MKQSIFCKNQKWSIAQSLLSKSLILALLLYQMSAWCLRNTIRQGQSTPITDLDFSTKSRDYVGIAREEGVYIYNQTTLQLLGGIINSSQTVSSISFSKNNNYLAIGFSNRNQMRIFNTGSSFPFTQMGYQPNIGFTQAALDFRDDSNQLVVCGPNNDVKLVSSFGGGSCNVNNGGISGGAQPASDCIYSPNPANQIGVTFSNKVLVQNSGNTITMNNNKNCNSIDFKPSGNPVVACVDANAYQITAGNNQGSSFYVNNASSQLTSAAYAPDGTIFFMGGANGNAFLFFSNKTLMMKFAPLDSAVVSSKFDYNSEKLLVGTVGGYVYLFVKDCELRCQTSYFFENKTCFLCHDYVPNCDQCTSSTTCIGCLTGFALVAGKCRPCAQAGCISCPADNLTCYACDMGYFINSSSKCQRCITLIPYCRLCNQSAYCLSCDQIAYFDSATNKCKLCNSTLARCQVCQSSTKCLSCEIGFFINGTNECNKCADYCTSCYTNEQCNECVRGYYVSTASGPYPSNNNCLRCSTSGCINCNNKNVCLECEDGKYLNSGTKACIQCALPCSTCNDTGKCYSCYNGYYLNTATNVCLLCDSGCQTCNQTGQCMSCFEGFALDSTTKKCHKCWDKYPNCSVCTQSGCLLCSQGFYLGTGCTACSKSISNCLLCNDSSNCLQCSQGYYETGLTGVDACKSCTLGCAKCVSQVICESCLSTFYYSSGSCSLCPAPCLTCSDSANCLSCQYGFYLDTHLCVECVSAMGNCAQCYNATYCSNCLLGYYLNAGKTACPKCPANCASCSGSATCNSCSNGYYLESPAAVCALCNDTCALCAGPATCSACKTGYYLKTDFSCAPCPATLKNCLQCSSPSVCSACTSGSYLDSTIASPTYQTCLSCDLKISSCLQCNQLQQCSLCTYGYGLAADSLSCQLCSAIQKCTHCQKYNSCLACSSGFYLDDADSDGNIECSPCSKGCQLCTTSAQCTTCSDGFYINNLNLCLPCSSLVQGCQACQNVTGTVRCSSCRRQYYSLSPTQCQLCSQAIFNCWYCQNSSFCELCQSGSYRNSSTNKCSRCSQKLDNCQMCSSDTACTQCQNGFYLDAAAHQCRTCLTNLKYCLSCHNETMCARCQSNAYLSMASASSHLCILCETPLPGCISCLSSAVCLQCQSGFYLDSSTNTCQLCAQKGCQVCHESDPTKCVTCNSFYLLQPATQHCILCNTLPQMSGCIDCDNRTGVYKCLSCMIGYYKNATDVCELCSTKIDGCIRCQTSTNCIQCESLYLLQSTSPTTSVCKICSSYIPHCQVCKSPTNCLSCEISYYLSPTNNSCEFCSNYLPNCIYCASISSCILCDTQYFVDASGQCKRCSQFISGCYTCLDDHTCTSCENGYVRNPSSGTCQTITVSSQQGPITSLKLITYYESKQKLKHILYSTIAFDKSISSSSSINLKTSLTLTLEDKDLNEHSLEISQYQFSGVYTLILWTNNPLDFQEILSKNSTGLDMQFRRLLASPGGLQQLNINTNFQMPKGVAAALLPSLDYNSDVKINYNLNSPQFYSSLIKANSQLQEAMPFYLFGYVTLGVLFINFAIRLMFTLPQSANKGQIIGHLIALKTVATSVYPCYFQMISFSKGFALFDFPWWNDFFGNFFGQVFDYAPQGYKMLYANINIGSTYIISLGIVLILLIFKWWHFSSPDKSNGSTGKKSEQNIFGLYNQTQNSEVNMKDSSKQSSASEGKQHPPTKQQIYSSFWFNVFGFSLVQFSLCSFYGALNNNFSQLNSLNFLFYLIGSFIFIVLILKILYILSINPMRNLNLLRITCKSIILSLAFLAPVYMAVLAFLMDISLIVVQYRFQISYQGRHSTSNGSSQDDERNSEKDLKKIINAQNNSKSVLTLKYLSYINQFLANLVLLLIYCVNTKLISLIGAGFFIAIIIVIQLGSHWKQYAFIKEQTDKIQRKQEPAEQFIFTEFDQGQQKTDQRKAGISQYLSRNNQYNLQKHVEDRQSSKNSYERKRKPSSRLSGKY